MQRFCADFLLFYNRDRPHSAFGGRTPDEVFFGRLRQSHPLARIADFDGLLQWYRFGRLRLGLERKSVRRALFEIAFHFWARASRSLRAHSTPRCSESGASRPSSRREQVAEAVHPPS